MYELPTSLRQWHFQSDNHQPALPVLSDFSHLMRLFPQPISSSVLHPPALAPLSLPITSRRNTRTRVVMVFGHKPLRLPWSFSVSHNVSDHSLQHSVIDSPEPHRVFLNLVLASSCVYQILFTSSRRSTRATALLTTLVSHSLSSFQIGLPLPSTFTRNDPPNLLLGCSGRSCVRGHNSFQLVPASDLLYLSTAPPARFPLALQSLHFAACQQQLFINFLINLVSAAHLLSLLCSPHSLCGSPLTWFHRVSFELPDWTTGDINVRILPNLAPS